MIAFRSLAAATALAIGMISAEAQVRFDHLPDALGVDHVYGGNSDFVVGGGAAVFDCNADGRPDLFLAGGEYQAGMFVNTSAPGGVLRFRPAELPAGLAGGLSHNITGAYPLDFDADGMADLFVMRFGQNVLLRGTGDCGFVDANDTVGLPRRDDWTTAFAATWEPGQSLPTLAIGNYVDRSRPLEPAGNCDESYLLRSSAEDPSRYGAPIPFPASHCPLSLMFVDWSGSGTPDLRATNDRQYYDPDGTEQLFRLDAGGLSPYGAEDGWADVRIWGMSLAAHDVVGNGLPDLSISNMMDQRLETLADDSAQAAAFVDIAFDTGTTAHRPYAGGDVRPSTGWHTQFADFDQDGSADLLIIKGNVDEMAEFAAFDPDNLLLRQADGTFEEAGVAAGLDMDRRGRGAAVADLNGDGCLDLAIVNRNQPASILHNIGCADLGNAIALTLRDTGLNRNAIGAVVRVRLPDRSETYFTYAGGGHGGGGLVPLHVGLGREDDVDIAITWPDGRVNRIAGLSAGRAYVLERAANGLVSVQSTGQFADPE